MKRPSRGVAEATAVVACVIAGTSVAIMGLYDLVPWAELRKDQGLASWVQAVSAPVAIAGAFYLARVEGKRADRLRAREDAERLRAAVATLRAVSGRIVDLVDRVVATRPGWYLPFGTDMLDDSQLALRAMIANAGTLEIVEQVLITLESAKSVEEALRDYRGQPGQRWNQNTGVIEALQTARRKVREATTTLEDRLRKAERGHLG